MQILLILLPLVTAFLAAAISPVEALSTAGLTTRSGSPNNSSSSPAITGLGGWQDAVGRARSLVSQMSLAEKVNLTTGLGSAGRCEGTLGGVERLGIPQICFQDGPTGVRTSDFVTVFPAGLTTAATWNRTLFEDRAVALAQEFRGKGINVLLGPVTGGPLGRSPYQGRNWEGFSADPFLHGEAAYATVKGIQSQGVIATAKHFLVYEQETFRQLYAADDPWTLNPINNTVNTYSANVDDRTMHELYLKPFMNAVRAGAGAIMCVYNQINGTQGCENSEVINGILKNELNFQGFVVSDWSAVFQTVPAVNAGTDAIMPGGATTGGYRNQVGGPDLLSAVQNGTVEESRVDDMVTRFLTQYLLRGQDQNYPHTNYKDSYMNTYINGTVVNEHVNVQADHRQIAEDVATEAVTLIFNHRNKSGKYHTGLPLDKRMKVAVFGSDAGPNPYGINGCQGWLGRGSNLCAGNHTSNGTNALGWGSGAGYFPYLIDPLAGIQEKVRYDGGAVESNLLDTDLDGMNGALIQATASVSDACLAFVQARSGEDSDRTSLELESNGAQLIKTVSAACSNTIVVVHTVGPTIIDEAFNNENITALVFPHLPGQESGSSLAKVLYGEVNPSGKMPYSVLSRADASHYVNITREYTSGDKIDVDFTEGVFIDYKQWDRLNVTPIIHFGHGISYTNFSYSGNVQLSVVSDGSQYPSEVNVYEDSGSAPGGDNSLWQYLVSIKASVTNTGSLPGAEVAQVYITLPSSADAPPRQLVGFEKVYLQPGETREICIKITRRDMSVWSVQRQAFHLLDGQYGIAVGPSSDAKLLHSSTSFQVSQGAVNV